MTRYEANNEILKLLQGYVQAYPDQRFGQILTNLDIATHNRDTLYDEGPYKGQWHMKDIFFEESEKMLKRILNEYSEQVEEVVIKDEPIDEHTSLDTED